MRPASPFAATAGVPTAIRSHKDYANRETFDAEIQSILDGWGAEIVCLAGFMRILSTPFAERWTGRMLNIHPSLLPLYKGLKPQQQALDARASESGCTVHWVIPELDDGPAILRRRVPVLPGDTAETLAARILVEEHKAYPAALAMVCRGEASNPALTVFVHYPLTLQRRNAMVGSISSVGSTSYASATTSSQSQEAQLEAQIAAKQAQLNKASGDAAKTLQQQIKALETQLQALEKSTGSSSVSGSGTSSTGSGKYA